MRTILTALLLTVSSFSAICSADSTDVQAIATNGSSGASEPHRLDALILYSEAAETLYNGDPLPRLEHLIDVSNEAFSNSGLDIQLNPVHIGLFPLDDTAATSTVLSAAVNDEALIALRDEHHADVVILYRPYIENDGCGTSFVAGTEDQSDHAFAHVSINCSSYTTAHETGHLLGLGHSHRQDSGGVTEYAAGHGIDAVFTTLMAYPSYYDMAPRLLTYSSPELNCQGFPCGVPIGEENPAHAVQAISETIGIVTGYRQAPADTSEEEPPVSLTPLEKAEASYQAYMPVYDAALAEFEGSRDELLAAYYETLSSFQRYAEARQFQLQLQQSEDSVESDLVAAQIQVEDTYLFYQFARQRREFALESYINCFHEILVPAAMTLAELRLTYEEELAKVSLSTETTD